MSSDTDAPQDVDPQEGDALETTDQAAEEKKPLSLEVEVAAPSACERRVTVTIAQEDVERYLDEAYSEIMDDAVVPGFRPGRAPRKLVEKRFREEIKDKVKGALLMDAMTQVNEEQEFTAISEPDFDFDAVVVPDDAPLTFEFDIEVRPEFEMPEWKGLKLKKPVRDFTEKDIERRKRQVLNRLAQLEPVDGPVENEEYVVLNMIFRHNGNTVSKVEERTVRVLPTLSFTDTKLEGFDELLAGKKAGDKATAKLTISAGAPNEALRGEEVEAELEILDVKKLSLPEMDEKLLGRLGVESEEQLDEQLLQDLERQLTYHQQQATRDQITASLTESADWDLPPHMLERQAEREFQRAVMELRRSGFDDEEILAHQQELRQNSASNTEQALKEHFILERIAEAEEIDAMPEDYDLEIALIAAQSNESERRVRARIDKHGMMDVLRNQIIERKVLGLITDEAEFEETTYVPERPEAAPVDHAVGGVRSSDIPQAKHGESKPLPEPTDHT